MIVRLRAEYVCEAWWVTRLGVTALLGVSPAASPQGNRSGTVPSYSFSAKRKHSEMAATFDDSLNFDAPHRANARTHAQAETANRLLSLCSIGSSKENHPGVEIKKIALPAVAK